MSEPTNDWYVQPAEVQKALHLPNSTDPRLARVCQSVSDSIDYHTGQPARMVPAPATVQEVALSWAVDVYKQPDAAFSVVGMGETGPVMMPRDSYKRFMQQLQPWTLAWGFA